TGASGFTGSWLTEQLLDAGAAVTTLVSESDPDSIFIRNGIVQRVRKVDGSILDFELLVRTIANHGIDTVLHLAAISVEYKVCQHFRRWRPELGPAGAEHNSASSEG